MSTTKPESPRKGAQRKKAHDDRKREQGLKEFRAWVTNEERDALRAYLLAYRQGET